ncbi:MAG TPA: hypothetical protein VGA03_04130, partial [Anaerolineales bacterium]
MQTILGHKYVDTTLRYARLYDGTIAVDYYRAMAQVERYLTLGEQSEASHPKAGELLPLLDLLDRGELNETQKNALHALRSGLQALVKHEVNLNKENVKVPA